MKRDLIVTAGGRERAVSIDGPSASSPADGRFNVIIDGVERVVDARLVRPGTWSILLDGASYVVDLDKRRTGIAASIGASEVLLQIQDALQARLASAAGTRTAARGESIRAPIAGKVVKVLVAVGDHVAVGSAVIVLEAMKMENELVAERGGTVTQVTKSAGQAVETGELLVELA